MIVNRWFIGFVVCVAASGSMADLAFAAPRVEPGVAWVPANPNDLDTTLSFHNSAYWAKDTYPNWTDPGTLPYWPGQESKPPGFDSAATIEGYRVVRDTTVASTYYITGNGYTGSILLDQNTSLGALAIGNSSPTSTPSTPDIQKLIISANVNFTGLERRTQADGWYNTQLRHIRVGRGRSAGDEYVANTGNYPDVNAWGIVQQTAGLVDLQQDSTTTVPMHPLPVSPQTNRAEILLSSDKDKSAGSIWEVGGTASLVVPDEVRLSDRETITQMSGHAIFRVRGSNHTGVGTPINVNTYDDPQALSSAITIGFPQTALAEAGRLKIVSRGGMWDIDRPGVDMAAPGYDPNYGSRHRYNEGKAILEFVLDEGGTTPIVLQDQLVLGGDDLIPASHPTLGGTVATPGGFLRIRLMEPTEAGFVGEDPIYLVHADRITTDASDGYVPVGNEFDDGRFFDPDRDGPALSGLPSLAPHRRVWNGDTVISEYAGATYNWTIEYFEPGVSEGDIGGSDDGDIDSYVRLVNGTVTGLPGDYNANVALDASDIDDIFAAMGTPISLGSKQNMFDLDGDEDVDYDDATEWVTHPSFADTLFGDLNLNGAVAQNDLDELLSNLNMSGGWADGDLDGDGFVDSVDQGILMANCPGCTLPGLSGDYNGNDKIDSADYTVWRDAMIAGSSSLLNDPTPGSVTESDFTYWRNNFGDVLGSGSGGGSAAIPEPGSMVLSLLAVGGLLGFRRRK